MIKLTSFPLYIIAVNMFTILIALQSSAGLSGTMELLGRETVIDRLRKAIKHCQ